MGAANGKLAGRVALITGATSGIGKATALLFAQEGAKVAFTGRRAELGMALAEEIRSFGGEVIFLQADHTRAEDCRRSVEMTVAHFGKINTLFNNAGVVQRGTAETTSEEDWAYTLSLNVTAVWRMSRLVIPYLRLQGGGTIVNNASDWGVVGARNAVAYATSKGAVVQMTRSMALDHAHENIRVNAICPGDTLVARWLETSYFKATAPAQLAEEQKQAAAYLPMKRFGKPEEIARAVLFLACEDSSFVTGVTLLADGGNTAQ
ncbi:MAG: SDR family NAD(P)-dependent oxidoreductase [Candidatus Villigracilaceae bacterium]